MTQVQAFTDSDMVVLLRRGIAELSISSSISIAGRSVTRSDLPSLIQALQYWEDRVASANGMGGLVALAELQSVNTGAGKSPPDM